jgi:flagellar basal-body rod protein FlgF
MDRMLYVAMSGAKQTMLAQAANNHNLANVNTTAFKADLNAFRSMPVFGEGMPSRVYAMAERSGVDFAPGMTNSTGRELDMTINGQGWFAVQAADGTEAYTRAGNLRISTSGLLVNGAGHVVLGNNGPIVIPAAEKIDIGSDGTISIRPQGQAASTLAVIDRIKLVNPSLDELEKSQDGLMRMKSGETLPPDAGVTVVSGALETSNVNPVESLVNLISLSRQFELQVKAMKTTEENESMTAQMLRLG